MGWTYTDLQRNRLTLDQVKADHVADCTCYSAPITAELIAHEWHKNTFFAIVRLSGGRYADKPLTWLRVDLIDTTGGQFGYKDGSEDMGMYNQDKPSREFAALIHKHIPHATGYAAEWRTRNGVKFDTKDQMQLAL